LATLAVIALISGEGSTFSTVARASSGYTLSGWGNNQYGQLGNNSTTNSSTPVVVSLPAGVTPTAFAAGQSHSLAIGSDGQLYTWGNNQYGQLGNNSTTNSPTPVIASLYPGVYATAVAAGSNHSLAIGNDGKLYAWGNNDHGQLGNGTTTNSKVPVMVSLPESVTPIAIAAGQSHSLAIGSDNQLYTWGYNSDGELGNNSTTDSLTPVTASLYPGVYATAIAGGQFHSMAIGTDGKLYTWGYNKYGQLGDGTTTNSKVPLRLSLPGGVKPTAIAGGYYHSLAIGNDGKLYAWGINYSGQLGNGTTTGTNANSNPVLVNLPAGVTPNTIAAGYNHSLATGSDGKLYAWGYNVFGQLGNGTTSDSSTPLTIGIAAGSGTASIAAGQYYTLGVVSIASQVAASSGSSQSATVGTAFGSPLVATVRDSSNNPISNVVVTFTAPSSGASGSFTGGNSVYTGTTNASGQITSTTFTANTISGSYNITTTVSGVITPAIFSLTNTASTLANLNVVSGNNQSATVDTSFANPLVVKVTDKYGNNVSGVSISFSAGLGGGARGYFTGGGTTYTAVSNASGLVTSTTFIANKVAGSYNLTASGLGGTPVTNFSLTNTAGAAANLGVVSGGGQSAAINTAFSNPLVASVTDQYGNLVSGVNVTFTAPASGASLIFAGTSPTTTIATTGSNGQATSPNLTANSVAGGYNVTATVTGIVTPATFSLINTAGPANSVSVVSGDNQQTAINTTFAKVLVAKVTDANGNGVSGVQVTFTTPASSGASAFFTDGPAMSTYTGTTDASGTVTTAVLTANGIVGSYSVTATVSGVNTPATFSLTNTGNSPANLSVVSGDRQNTMVNTAFSSPLVVSVTDQNGNPVSGVNVTFTAPASGASLIFAGTSPTTTIVTTDSNGQATSPNPTANSVAGGYNVTARVSGVTNSASFSLTNLAGIPVSISMVSGSGQSALINQPFSSPLVAKVVDSNNNGVAGIAVNFTAPTSGASGTFAGNRLVYTGRTDSSGVVTSTLFTANTTDGDYTVTATVNGVATPASFTLTNASLYAWGANYIGQLGDGTATNSSNPLPVGLPGGAVPTAVAAGFAHNLAIADNGNLYAWGYNQFGQLGTGTVSDSTTPVLVKFPAGVVPTAISLGFYHSLAIGSDGKLYGWGFNADGELGTGTSATVNPFPVMINLPGGITPIAISAGTYHNLAIGSDGKLYAWGSNIYGQLGNGTTTDSSTPVVVNLPAGVTPTAIAAAYYHSLAIGSDGKLYAWGYNADGQLGNGTTTGSSTPVVVNLPAGVTPTAITKGYYHSLAIGSDGKLYAWGRNNAGALGNGTTTNSSTPVVVSLPAGVIPSAIATGLQDSLAIASNSKVYAWGDNSSGQLGDGTTTNSTTPVVVNLPPDMTPSAIAAGANHSLAIFGLPYLSISSVSKTEGNSGTTSFTFTVTLSAASSQTVTVNYATADGTATAPADYTATSGTLTFSPGITTATVIAPVKGDTLGEPDETFKVTLSNPANAIVDRATGLGIIRNDDSLCQPLVVTAITDDGTGATCGTLSYALTQPVSGSSGMTITFALTQGNTITFTGSLTTTAKVKAGVTIYGGAFGSSSRIILNGNGVSGNGLDLLGHTSLVNLTIKNFKGRPLVLEGTANRLQGVVVIRGT
jgi:alpha-tubulin suppressor-like RCC1 family protein